ncbi:helix-turn-helix transcriptional regulator [Streptomyces sp. NPDC002574]|uniref:helix-turn-helix transcriptional regulator n=1 Tax=Streptomyces sp. NPDC002574 TaxID=3364652 RepID=UPI0036B57EF6
MGTTSPATDLKDFLTSRRSRLTPRDIGLAAAGGRRRVAGLRREEVAKAAGISVDYYTRMEQGRVTGASPEILDALATALRLDEDETQHMHRIAGARPPRRRPAPAGDGAQTARPILHSMLKSLDGTPAVVMGRGMTVLAWNRAAAALLGDFAGMAPADRNIAKLTFLDPRSRSLYAAWDACARESVAYLRLEAGLYPDDPVLASVVGDLAARSPEFRDLWAQHPVQDRTSGTKGIHHPVVGDLTLSYETLRVADDPAQALVVYTTEPGSASAESLRLLLDWTADAQDAGMASGNPTGHVADRPPRG